MRDDLAGRLAPRHLRRLLERRYGCTPWGEPLYRLVWAPSRLERSGGLWTDWRGGTQARGMGLIRRIAEVRWVRKYPGEDCWLVEQWTPPSAYGNPEDWGRPVALGGTMLPTEWGPVPTLGPFPARGDYEDLGARIYWYPSERHVTLAIDATRCRRAAAADAPRQRISDAAQRAQEREARREEEFERFCHDVLGDAAPAFGGTPMAGYGPKTRPSLIESAESIGIRQHPY